MFCQKDDFSVFLEVSHSYIDQHFVISQLWATDEKKAPTYPIKLLFSDAPITEALVNEPRGRDIHSARGTYDPHMAF